MPRGCLQFVIVVFPDHTHLLCNVSFSYFHLNLCISADWMEMGNPIYFFFCKFPLFPDSNNKGQIPVRG